jgi:hypothetical protein
MHILIGLLALFLAWMAISLVVVAFIKLANGRPRPPADFSYSACKRVITRIIAAVTHLGLPRPPAGRPTD